MDYKSKYTKKHFKKHTKIHMRTHIKGYTKTITRKRTFFLLSVMAFIMCFSSIKIIPYLTKCNNNTDRLSNKILNTPAGGTVTFYMNGMTKLPKNIIKNLDGKDINLIIVMDNGIVWTINGMNVTNPKMVTLGVAKNTNNIPIETMKNISDKNLMQISLDYDNEFGFTANLSIELASKNNGLYANLFYYNPETKKLEFIDYGLIENSMANLKFSHASDYVIIIDNKPLGSPDKTISNIFIRKQTNAFISNEIITYPICFAAILIIACIFIVIIIEYTQKNET